jgi:hypothetical protein
MGVLTSNMTRLHGEVVASKHAREAMMKDLARGTVDLKKAVTGMLGAFRTQHTRMARTSRSECARFLKGVETTVGGIKKTVAGLRKEFATDLAGARSAWLGTTRAAKTARSGGKTKRRAH